MEVGAIVWNVWTGNLGSMGHKHFRLRNPVDNATIFHNPLEELHQMDGIMSKPKIIYCGCDPGRNLAFVGFCDGKFFGEFARIKGVGLARRMDIQALYGRFMQHTYDYDKSGFEMEWAMGAPFVGRYVRAAMAHAQSVEAVEAIIDKDGTITRYLDTEARRIVFGRAYNKQEASDRIIEYWWPEIPLSGGRKQAKEPNEHLADAAVFALALASRSGVNIQKYMVRGKK